MHIVSLFIGHLWGLIFNFSFYGNEKLKIDPNKCPIKFAYKTQTNTAMCICSSKQRSEDLCCLTLGNSFGWILVISGIIMLCIGPIGIHEDIVYNSKLIEAKTSTLGYTKDYVSYKTIMNTNCSFVTNRTTDATFSCQAVTRDPKKYYMSDLLTSTCYNCDEFVNCTACNYVCTSKCTVKEQQLECVSNMEKSGCKLSYAWGTTYNCNQYPENAISTCNQSCTDFSCQGYNYQCNCKCSEKKFSQCPYVVVGVVKLTGHFGYIVNGTKYIIDSGDCDGLCAENDNACISQVCSWYPVFNPWVVYYYEDDPKIRHTYRKPVIGSAPDVAMVIFGIIFTVGGLCTIACTGVIMCPHATIVKVAEPVCVLPGDNNKNVIQAELVVPKVQSNYVDTRCTICRNHLKLTPDFDLADRCPMCQKSIQPILLQSDIMA